MALPQPLHILRKDTVHLWPEILAVLALFAAFAWAAPSHWSASPYAGVATILAAFLKGFLMPISWLVLISRLIHDEPLVGDRQFWTSRPYHWAKLLAAKLLFLACFLYLPFLLMQVFLLKRAGLYPTTVIPQLLHNLLLLTVIIVIPIAALAAVTATFARLLLTVLGAMVYLVVLSLLVVWINFQHLPPPALEPFLVGIFIALPAAVLIYQYATRRTLIARLALAATPLLILLLLVLTPATALIRHSFPLASGPHPGTVPAQYLPQDTPPGKLLVLRNAVELGLPYSIEGIDKDSNYLVSGVATTVDAGSTHWASPYMTAQGQQQFNASTPLALAPVAMPLPIFNAVKSTPARVHLSLAALRLHADPVSTWHATLLPFSVPGKGVCSYSPDDPDAPPVCRYPFSMPEFTLVSAPVTPGTCAAPAGPLTPGGTRLASGSSSSLDFDPVVSVPLVLSTGDPRASRTPYALCPGTELHFLEAHEAGRARFEVDLPNLQLDRYAAHQPLPATLQPLPPTQQ